jgi:serine protease Do
MKNKKLAKKTDKITSKIIILSLFISMIVGSVFGLLVSLATIKYANTNGLKNSSEGTSEENKREKSNLSQDANESTIIDVVDKSNPAVVSIIISKDIPIIEHYYENPFEGFEGFFGWEVPRVREKGTEKREIGGGSGFLISSDGYLVTNKHVVSDEEAEYTVLTNEGEKFEVQILDRDPVNDIAILKINPSSTKLPYLELGDSSSLKVGQSVITIGNALGEFRNTVSKGIISGLKRDITAGNNFGYSENLSELIQTDAAVNQGNSGGPLLDLEGKVIGVNVAMANGAENIGFALPINLVKVAAESVKQEGKIIRPFIGIRYIINNEEIAEENELDYNYGALIQRGEKIGQLAIIPGSPADKAGLAENDIILEINGKKIEESYTPSSAIADKKPGDKITLKIWSKGIVKDTELTLGEK